MQQNIPQWKYERDFNFKEGISSIEGTRYDLNVNENQSQQKHFDAADYAYFNSDSIKVQGSQ